MPAAGRLGPGFLEEHKVAGWDLHVFVQGNRLEGRAEECLIEAPASPYPCCPPPRPNYQLLAQGAFCLRHETSRAPRSQVRQADRAGRLVLAKLAHALQ